MPTTLFTANNPPTLWRVPTHSARSIRISAEVQAAGRLLFISGQFGAAPDGKLLGEFAPQCEQAVDNVEALLSAARYDHGKYRRSGTLPRSGRMPAPEKKR